MQFKEQPQRNDFSDQEAAAWLKPQTDIINVNMGGFQHSISPVEPQWVKHTGKTI